MVAPEMRGQGFGKALLKQFVRDIPGNYRAEIRNENAASLQMVIHAGFRFSRELDGYQEWIYPEALPLKKL